MTSGSPRPSSGAMNLSRDSSLPQDGRTQPWRKLNWCNPPYNKIAPWVQRALVEATKGNTTVALLRVNSETAWFSGRGCRPRGSPVAARPRALRVEGRRGVTGSLPVHGGDIWTEGERRADPGVGLERRELNYKRWGD